MACTQPTLQGKILIDIAGARVTASAVMCYRKSIAAPKNRAGKRLNDAEPWGSTSMMRTFAWYKLNIFLGHVKNCGLSHYLIAATTIIIVQASFFNPDYVWHDDWGFLENWQQDCWNYGWNGWLRELGRPFAAASVCLVRSVMTDNDVVWLPRLLILGHALVAMVVVSACFRRCGVGLAAALLMAVVVLMAPGTLIAWCGFVGLPVVHSLILISLSFLLTLEASSAWWRAGLWGSQLRTFPPQGQNTRFLVRGAIFAVLSAILFTLGLLFYQGPLTLYCAFMFLPISLWIGRQPARVLCLVSAASVTAVIGISAYTVCFIALKAHTIHGFGESSLLSKGFLLWTTMAPLITRLWFFDIPTLIPAIIFASQVIGIVLWVMADGLRSSRIMRYRFPILLMVLVILLAIPYLAAMFLLSSSGEILYRTSSGLVLLSMILWYLSIRGGSAVWQGLRPRFGGFRLGAWQPTAARACWIGAMIGVAGAGSWFNAVFITRYPALEVGYMRQVILKARDDHRHLDKVYVYLKPVPARSVAFTNDELMFLASYRRDDTMIQMVDVIFDRLRIKRPAVVIKVATEIPDPSDGFIIDMRLAPEPPLSICCVRRYI